MSETNNKNDEITLFAETNFRNQNIKFGIKTTDRRKHIYVIGKTGMGKTTLLENMAIQDIVAGRGVGIVDPHGEFAEKMLLFVPEERRKDVIYFNPADTAFPVAFNPMERVESGQRHLVASGLLGVFKKIWPDVWSPRMEYLLSNAILALLEIPDSTLLGINRMFAEKDFRKQTVARLTDPVVKAFWEKEYAQYQERFATEASAAIQNKVGQFISNPLIRNIVGQPASVFDIRKIMDEGKILIMNLSKGKIGEENSRLLGAMLVTNIYLTAMTRVDLPREEDRRDFYLYVDEFQNFATESFASILSEARKYRLNLVLAHQYIAQMDEKVCDAVFGNVGSMVSFRVGAQDAEVLEKEFSPEFMIQDLVNLGFAQVYLKLMIDGVASRPFSATTLAPYPLPAKSFKEEIIKWSREHYGKGQGIVEENINSYFGPPKEAPAALAPEQKTSFPKSETRTEEKESSSGPSKKLFEAQCVVDGKKVFVPFEVDKNRPVYCQEHLEMLRRGELRGVRDNYHERRDNYHERRDNRVSAFVSASAPRRPPFNRSTSMSESKPRTKIPLSIPGGKFVIRHNESVKPISLKDLPIGKKDEEDKEDESDAGNKRQLKKEVNLGELKSLIKETMRDRNNTSAPPNFSGTPNDENNEAGEDDKENKKGVLHPGESVRF